MNPTQIELVLNTYAVVRGDAALTARFYELLFEADESARALFADSRATAPRFAAELEHLTGCLGDLGRLEQRTSALGARHHGYGVTSRHYAAAAGALVQALGERLGDAFDAEAARAWRAAFDLVAETMMAVPDTHQPNLSQLQAPAVPDCDEFD